MLRARHVGVGVPRDVLAQRSRRVSTRGFCSGNPTFPTRRATGSRAARPSRSRDAPMDARPIAVGFPHASSPSLNAPHAPRVRRARLSVAPCRSSVRLIADVSSSLSPPQPPKAPESKAAKAAKAMAGGKGKKKKWSKGKNKEKANNQVLFEQSTYDKLMAEVPKYKMILRLHPHRPSPHHLLPRPQGDRRPHRPGPHQARDHALQAADLHSHHRG